MAHRTDFGGSFVSKAYEMANWGTWGAMKEPSTEQKLQSLLALVKGDGSPNINALWGIAKDLEGIKLSLKFFGYDLARRLYDERRRVAPDEPGLTALRSKPSTQSDLESQWVAYWCGKLGIAPVYHRKVWELCYALQAFHEHGLLKPGARGLGFGCGEEPLPSLMAAMGVDVTVTDLDPAEAAKRGWVSSTQHTSTLDKAYMAHIVDRATFDRHVALKFVDMNAIDKTLAGYDFCWSICALEHLGSIGHGLRFIENSLATVRPGGLAVHTTEFNFLRDDATIDNWPTVLFQRRHFMELTERLTAAGHAVAPLDFDVGDGPLDKFIDLPPFAGDMPDTVESWKAGSNHIKLMVDGFASTCFGLIVKKAG